MVKKSTKNLIFNETLFIICLRYSNLCQQYLNGFVLETSDVVYRSLGRTRRSSYSSEEKTVNIVLFLPVVAGFGISFYRFFWVFKTIFAFILGVF